ncbi:MAG: ZIP family metal transporter [Burkholderiales bacterium]|nr:MAG: ZIP family metal transporter [Burkholderiales bacterium]
MSPLSAILLACIAGAVLSLLAASLTLVLRGTSISRLIAFAVGTLLGAVFLEVLPHALATGRTTEGTLGVVLAGILLFFLLEKLVLWRHSHPEDDAAVSHAHAPEDDHGRSGLMILVGDTFHNFCDGILIAAAFMSDFQLGVVTAVAIIAHEIPQEIGDFLVLLNSGYSRAQALAFNLGTSLATLAGGLLGFFMLAALQSWVPVILALAAASMLYVAVADLIPGLHRKSGLAASVQQVLLIAAGIALIAGVDHWLAH